MSIDSQYILNRLGRADEKIKDIVEREGSIDKKEDLEAIRDLLKLCADKINLLEDVALDMYKRW